MLTNQTFESAYLNDQKVSGEGSTSEAVYVDYGSINSSSTNTSWNLGGNYFFHPMHSIPIDIFGIKSIFKCISFRVHSYVRVYVLQNHTFVHTLWLFQRIIFPLVLIYIIKKKHKKLRKLVPSKW